MTGALKVTVPISELLLVVGHLSKCSSELKYELLHLSLPLAVLVAVVRVLSFLALNLFSHFLNRDEKLIPLPNETVPLSHDTRP